MPLFTPTSGHTAGQVERLLYRNVVRIVADVEADVEDCAGWTVVLVGDQVAVIPYALVKVRSAGPSTCNSFLLHAFNLPIEWI